MNITDIDDKVSATMPLHDVFLAHVQIILRARESHLLERIASQHATLSLDLINQVQEAFQHFFNRKVLKNLPSPVEPSASGITGQAYFADILKRDQSDPEFARVAREKEEKWSLYLTSLGKADRAIQGALQALEGNAGAEAVKELIDESADVLGPYLGDTVRLHSDSSSHLDGQHSRGPQCRLAPASIILGESLLRRHGPSSYSAPRYRHACV